MERKIIQTSDGSRSLYLPSLDETYHSRHGAVQEAYHVFINKGLDLFEDRSELRILEVGFGTGLNCFITWLESQRRNLSVEYHGLEAFPVELKLTEELNYPKALDKKEFSSIFKRLHEVVWNKRVDISEQFSLFKEQVRFEEFEQIDRFDLIYFDAFGARVQPDLWTEEIFKRMFSALKKKGILVTYSAKGSVRRAMQSVGFKVERLPGPPGKREMLRAVKGEI